MDLKWGVSNWQSMKQPPTLSIAFAKKINANFEALGTNENMLSPMKALCMVTP